MHMQHCPCLSMKVKLIQDAIKAHMCTKNPAPKMNTVLSTSKLYCPKTTLSRCTTTLK